MFFLYLYLRVLGTVWRRGCLPNCGSLRAVAFQQVALFFCISPCDDRYRSLTFAIIRLIVWGHLWGIEANYGYAERSEGQGADRNDWSTF